MTYAIIKTTEATFNAREKSFEIPQTMGHTVYAPKSRCTVMDKFDGIVYVAVPWWCFTNKDTNPVYSIYFEQGNKGEWRKAYDGIVER